jgi:GntR family transcriptional regulator, transcriptional repressor for pyruvate dehydrogenase complex
MVAEFSKLETAPAYRQVHDEIERRIMDGTLKAGDVLPAETKLADQFGVNRSTIREGIRLLEQGGLVQRANGGKRLHISLPHYRDLASRASRAMIMHETTFRELWEASMALEVTTASYAVSRISPQQIDMLFKNLDNTERAVGDDSEFIKLDIAFHDIVAEAAGNRALSLAREPISLLFFPAGRIILPRLKSHQRVIDAHRHIVEALKNRDQAMAEEWMKKHMADFRRAYELTDLDIDQPLDAVGT